MLPEFRHFYFALTVRVLEVEFGAALLCRAYAAVGSPTADAGTYDPVNRRHGEPDDRPRYLW